MVGVTLSSWYINNLQSVENVRFDRRGNFLKKHLDKCAGNMSSLLLVIINI